MNKQQLANRIWASANKMRSKIDANEYKDYILGLIFYKFLSDTEVKYLKKQGWEDEDLVNLVEDFEDDDMRIVIEECQNTIGFFIEYKYLFNAWVDGAAEFDVAVLSEALGRFEILMSPNYTSVYKGIFKTLREGLSKLGENPTSQTKSLKGLVKLIKDIPTDGSQDYDVLGYVYEFLISNFAANAGKKAGEFYTPHEVAMVMSEIVADHHSEKSQIDIYDPTSGSGSLLITIGKAVGKHIAEGDKVKYYAQELKENTYNLTRMNLVMRGIKPSNIITRCADSLEQDWPVQEEGMDIGLPLAVDAVVSNPPYSQHWDAKDKELDPRFAGYGVAPKTKADYAFLLHELHHLKPDGIMTIVLPHGVLFRGGNEGDIRTNLIEKNNIDAIIGLPANIFFGTSIPTLIMVLKKHRQNDDVLIIDASKGFVKDGKNNKLRACDVKRIADTYRERLAIPGYSRVVTRDEIRANDYNLNIPRYVDSSEAPEKFDLYATMFGGIPNSELDNLAGFWQAFPSLRGDIFAECSGRPYSEVKTDDIAATVRGNADVAAFCEKYNAAFADFSTMLRQRLIDNYDQVRDLEESEAIAADIFRRVEALPLVDKYAAYQVLANHWQAIMGDIEVLQEEGYDAARVVETKYKVVKKNGIEEEQPDGQKGRIMPFDLVQRILLSYELDIISELEQQKENAENDLAELRDSLDADEQEQLLNEDNTDFDKKAVEQAWNEVLADLVTPEIQVLTEYLAFSRKAEKVAFIAAHPEAPWSELTLNNGVYKPADVKALIAQKKQEFTFGEDTFEYRVKLAAATIDKVAELTKTIKEAKKELEATTIKKIQSLDKKEVDLLLENKWIVPVCEALAEIPVDLKSYIVENVSALGEKYATTLNDVETQICEAETQLSSLIANLTGDAYAIEGLAKFINK